MRISAVVGRQVAGLLCGGARMPQEVDPRDRSRSVRGRGAWSSLLPWRVHHAPHLGAADAWHIVSSRVRVVVRDSSEGRGFTCTTGATRSRAQSCAGLRRQQQAKQSRTLTHTLQPLVKEGEQGGPRREIGQLW